MSNRGLAMMRMLSAEFIGTFWLVFGGCGSAVIAAGFPQLGIGFVGVSLAFGLTVLTMAYAVGGISGGHFNPAVSLGLMMAGRFEARLLAPYWITQVLGALAAAAVLYVIASGAPGFTAGGFASNGYGALSPGKYAMVIAQLWLFWLAPLVGAAIGAMIWNYLLTPGENSCRGGARTRRGLAGASTAPLIGGRKC